MSLISVFAFFLSALNFHTCSFASEIAVVTMAIGEKYRDAVEVGIKNKESYCRIHHYDFIMGDHVLDDARPIPWTKILLLLEVMKNKECKWVFWTDADSLIMNKEIKLEDLIDEDCDLIITKELHYYNSGQFLLKNSEWSRDFLLKVYSHDECIHHGWWEQMAIIIELQDQNNMKHTKVLPRKSLNSHHKDLNPADGYSKGDFIIHFLGERDVARLKMLMTIYARRAG